MKNKDILIIGCGAIAHEINEIIKLNNWNNVSLQCLNADLHNTPKKLPTKIKETIESNLKEYSKIFLAYADCGTGGLIDSMLKNYGIERLEGAHCYEFYAGSRLFKDLSDREIGTFYLTDFLVKNFKRLIIDGLGISKHPSLKDEYFKNYKILSIWRRNMTMIWSSKPRIVPIISILNIVFTIPVWAILKIS